MSYTTSLQKNHNATNTLAMNFHMEKLESVQCSAARAGAWKSTSQEKLLEELISSEIDMKTLKKTSLYM